MRFPEAQAQETVDSETSLPKQVLLLRGDIRQYYQRAEVVTAQHEERQASLLQAIRAALAGEADTTILTQLQKLRTSLLDKQDELIQQLNQIAEKNQAAFLRPGLDRIESLHNILQKISDGLSGSDESGVTAQIKALRAVYTEKQDALLAQFTAFAEKMAADNSKALIQALEGVMRDFNARLNEHVGDNFKRLNEGVQRLLEWQDSYRIMVETTTNLLAEYVKRVADAADALERQAEESGKLAQNADTLGNILAKLDLVQQDLTSHLASFASISEKAEQALPMISTHVNELTENFAKAVQKSLEKQQMIVDQQSIAVTEIETRYKTLNDTLAQQMREATKIQLDVLAEVSKSANSKIEQLSEILNESLRKSSASLRDAVTELDRGLEVELKKALDGLGSQLASLSAQFVKDYTPLTQKLADVVRLAKRLGKDGDDDEGV